VQGQSAGQSTAGCPFYTKINKSLFGMENVLPSLLVILNLIQDPSQSVFTRAAGTGYTAVHLRHTGLDPGSPTRKGNKSQSPRV
jgi:hypothetical protein